MDTKRLLEILRDSTSQFRKGGEVVEKGNESVQVTEIFAMPHESEAVNLEKIDCHFVTVGVDKSKALGYKDELVKILADWPSEAWGAPVPNLKEGPSYIHVGGVVGDQGAAFQLFALGQVLDFWKVITPETLKITGPEADDLAGRGFVMIDGYKP